MLRFRFIFPILLGAFACTGRAGAQTEGALSPDSRRAERYDSAYVGVCHNFITLKPIIVLKSTQVTLEEKGKRVDYSPNPRLHAGVEVAYRRLVLAVTFGVPGTEKSEARYGNTEYLDFKLQLLTRRVGVEGALYHYKGHYLSNPAQVLASWRKSDAMPLRPDLQHTSLFANAYYVFNHRKYSLRGALLQLEEQRRTAHTFLLLAGFQYLVVKADSSLVPEDAKPEFQQINPLKTVRLMSFALAPGYAGAFVWGRVNFAPMVFIGPALQRGTVTTETEKHHESPQLGLKFNVRASLYYRGPRWFTGFSFYYDLVNYRVPNATVKASLFNGRFFFGYHFDKPVKRK